MTLNVGYANISSIMPPPSFCLGSGLTALLKTTRDIFIEDAVEQALDASWADGLALNFKENGMVERTRYGQFVEDEAAEEAAELFDRILKTYSTNLAKFTQEGDEYANEIEYALTMMDETQLSDEEQTALERITATHEEYLKNQKERKAQNKSEQQQLAQFLLKAPLEFADYNSSTLFNTADQQDFSKLLNKLRSLAAD